MISPVSSANSCSSSFHSRLRALLLPPLSAVISSRRGARYRFFPIVRRLCEYGLSMGVLGPQDEIRVSVALEEALLNAVIHGNLEVSSRLREEEGDAFDRQIRERQQLDVYSDRRVRVDCEVTRDEVRYHIADEGPGFDVSKLPDPRDPERILLASGRGVLMMRAFMDEVEYNARGNAVTLVKRRAKSACGVDATSRRTAPTEPAAASA